MRLEGAGQTGLPFTGIAFPAPPPGPPLAPVERAIRGEMIRHGRLHGPIRYSDYLERQNRRDPTPRLADVYERTNQANAARPASLLSTGLAELAPTSGACCRVGCLERTDTDGATVRRFGAPRIGDVTTIAATPAAARAGGAATQHGAGRVIDRWA